MNIELPALSLPAALQLVAGLVFFAFVMGGVLPVLIVRLIALVYPRRHPRRAELPAEMVRAKSMKDLPEQYMWLGGMFATALCEGAPLRIKAQARAGLLVLGWIVVAAITPVVDSVYVRAALRDAFSDLPLPDRDDMTRLEYWRVLRERDANLRANLRRLDRRDGSPQSTLAQYSEWARAKKQEW